MFEQRCFFHKAWLTAYLRATEWLYGPLAWAYDLAAWLVSFGDWSRWRRDALAYLSPGRILETGFGTGSLLIEMTRQGLDVIGIDASWPMQRVTGRKASRAEVSPLRLQAVAQRMPFPAGSFANVLSTFPTNYISDSDTLAEILRILSPHGRWVIVGLGLRVKSPLKQFLVGWLLGDWENAWVRSFIGVAKTAGYAPCLIQHETDAYLLPVLILEKKDEA